jgi:hypothetical protein
MAMPIFNFAKNAFEIPKEGAIPFQRNIRESVNLLQFDKFAGKRTQHQATTLGTKVTGKKTVGHRGFRTTTFREKNWGDRPDSNRRPPAPQAGALTN